MQGNNKPLLTVEDLVVDLHLTAGVLHVVRNVSFSLRKGETLGIVGESGSAKSMTSLALMGLLPSGGIRSAKKLALGDIDLLQMSEKEFANTISGKRIAMIFQDPMTSLNPVYTIGRQLTEQPVLDRILTQSEANERAIYLLEKTGVPAAALRMKQYPHQLSGGLRQRVMIAMMLINEPDLIIADEPTTALDVTVQAQILKLLAGLQKELGMAMILISHDLGLISRISDKVAVMYAGEIVEMGSVDDVLRTPRHPYTQGLLACMPENASEGGRLGTIPGIVPNMLSKPAGCAFANRCRFVQTDCSKEPPPVQAPTPERTYRCVLPPDLHLPTEAKTVRQSGTDILKQPPSRKDVVLTATGIRCSFIIRPSIFSPKRILRAVDDVSLELHKGETLALVGESGCGKTTLARTLFGLQIPGSGTISLDNRPISNFNTRELATFIQPVFQDPYSSLNPRRTVGQAIARPLYLHNMGTSAEIESTVRETMSLVGLPEHLFNSYPNQISGGQRQRVAIARALILRPSILVCDEPTSALDVSVQAQILNLLFDLRDTLGLSYVIVTHDLAVVRRIATRIAVMYLGKIVEQGPAADVLNKPRHPYTKSLLGSILDLRPGGGIPAAVMKPGFADALNVPSGCRFHPRCPVASDRCVSEEPVNQDFGDHVASCHLLGEIDGKQNALQNSQ